MMRAALLLLLGLMACGCSQGPGGVCTGHGDCEPPLRCTGLGGQRGVCTYPFDARVDGRPRDAAVDRRAADRKARESSSD